MFSRLYIDPRTNEIMDPAPVSSILKSPDEFSKDQMIYAWYAIIDLFDEMVDFGADRKDAASVLFAFISPDIVPDESIDFSSSNNLKQP